MSTETFENFAYEEVDCERYQLWEKGTAFYEAEIIEVFIFSMVWLTLKGVVAGDCKLTEHVYDETHIDEELSCQRCLSQILGLEPFWDPVRKHQQDTKHMGSDHINHIVVILSFFNYPHKNELLISLVSFNRQKGCIDGQHDVHANVTP